MNLRGLFITGTDTGVGKTFVAAAIIDRLRREGHRVGAYKPAVSGSEPGPAGLMWRDLEILAEACGNAFPIERICPQRFQQPLAPPVAARLEGRRVDAALLREGAGWWVGRVDVLVVEGAGGLLSPLTEQESVADTARDLGFPLILVARAGLGTLNHTLLTLEAARQRGLIIAGIVLNQSLPDATDRSVETNPQELANRCSVPILMNLPHGPADGLLKREDFHRIDWLALMQNPTNHGFSCDM